MSRGAKVFQGWPATAPYRRLGDGFFAVDDASGIPLWIGPDRCIAAAFDTLVAGLLSDRLRAKDRRAAEPESIYDKSRLVAAAAITAIRPRGGEWNHPPMDEMADAIRAANEGRTDR